MISIFINGNKVIVKRGLSILEAARFIGITLPRFCYHELLSISGNCRMCLVEVENIEKPIASCITEIEPNMKIWTESPFAKKARENIVEVLLLNHPLDCPICDQAGECDLQDQAKTFGSDYSRLFFKKRGVEDKIINPLIKTIMTRCIHCTRCVRFGTEVAGITFLGTLNRGKGTEIGGYINNGLLNSEITGNLIDLCPVGALTSKQYAFKARPWELRVNESIDLTDGIGSNIYINFKESEILRIMPKANSSINNNIISDKARFLIDGLVKNRLNFLYEKNSKNENKKINWNLFFDKIDQILKENNKIQIYISNEIDIETVIFLKNLKNKYVNLININIINSTNETSNILINKQINKISQIDTISNICLLFSTNPKLESTILNSKIRYKYKNSNIKLYSIGQTFDYNIPTNFINLNIKSIVNILEGKKKYISFNLIKSKKPLILIGESFKKRTLNINNIINICEILFPNSLIINIALQCNTTGLEILNINENLNINNKKIIFCLNLSNNLILQKKLKQFSKDSNTFWFNTHISNASLNSNFSIPTTTSFENENTYINLESRAQKTQKSLNLGFENKNILTILMGIFNYKNYKLPSYINYIEEITKNSKLFDNITTIFNKKNILLNNSTKINLYPLKSSIEDFYCSNSLTQNSLTLINASKYNRKHKNNFNV